MKALLFNKFKKHMYKFKLLEGIKPNHWTKNTNCFTIFVHTVHRSYRRKGHSKL